MNKIYVKQDPFIVANTIKCNLCGDIISSHAVHNYVTCKCGAVSVDGGKSYLKRKGSRHLDYTDMSVLSNAPFEKIREALHRYNMRIGGYTALKDIDDEWLENILLYYTPPDNKDRMEDNFLLLYLKEKQYRYAKEKTFEEENISYKEDNRKTGGKK